MGFLPIAISFYSLVSLGWAKKCSSMSEVVHGHIHFKKAGHVFGGQCLNLKFYQAGSAILEMAKGPVNGLAPSSLYDTDETCTSTMYYVCIHVDTILLHVRQIRRVVTNSFLSSRIHGIHMIIRERRAFYNLRLAELYGNSIVPDHKYRTQW